MRFVKTLPMAKFTRAAAVGALLAVSWTATGAMNNAYAAWSMVTKADAYFFCATDKGCQAGGIGPVSAWTSVFPPTIGAWERTVLIQCKAKDSNNEKFYFATVQDKNWAGKWTVYADQLTRVPYDADFPVC